MHPLIEAAAGAKFSQQLEIMCTSGRPFRLQTVRVVAEDGSVVQPGSGAVGEVQCRGSTVFDGYWNDPEATAKSFEVAAPEDEQRRSWFRTGDLATVDSRGYLSVVDRKTDMVLVGGENVYTVGHHPPPPEYTQTGTSPTTSEINPNIVYEL
jgi:acyl-CoA synthetase (AMP-forming)/AMP-acid ligase II